MHVMSDVTLHVNMTPLTVEDQLLIKTYKLKKAVIVEKMIVSVQRDSGNGSVLFDHLWE